MRRESPVNPKPAKSSVISWKTAAVPCLAVLVFFLSCFPALAAKTGPRPGENDTVSAKRRSLFKDNEVCLVEGRHWENKIKYYAFKPDKDNLEDWSETHASWEFLNDGGNPDIDNSDEEPVAAGSGRIESHKYDSVVHACFQRDHQIQVTILKQDGTTRLCTWAGAGASKGGRSVDLAVADLDGVSSTVQENNGNTLPIFHDEILVARTCDDINDKRGYRMDVLEMDEQGKLLSVAQAYDEGSLDHDIRYVSAVAGDFDGDLKNEFAVAVSGDDGDTKIITYKITLDTNGGRVFKTIDVRNVATTSISMDMTAGDFDGDGRDELLMVHGRKPIRYYVFKYETGTDGDADWITHDHDIVDGNEDARALGENLRVVSGLFRMDPEKGYDFGMKQALVVYASGDGSASYIDMQNHIKLVLLDVRNLDKVKTIDTYQIERCVGDPMNGIGSIQHIDAAVGNFIGHGQNGKAQSPEEQVAVCYQWWKMSFLGQDAIEGHQSIAVLLYDKDNKALRKRYEKDLDSVDCSDDEDREKNHYLSALAAPDRDGDTWVLGPPLHIVVENYLGMDYYLQEPPKHVDYLPDANGKWQMINVSAYDDFYMMLQDSEKKTLETKTTHTSSFDIGVSASFEFKSGFDCDMYTGSTDIKTKFAYDYKSKEENYKGQYNTETIGWSKKTNDDDIIVYRYQLLDIWRYPVFGFDSGDAQNPIGLYELVFPGPKEPKNSSGKACSDWFQPSHTNHNLLSYPPGELFGTELPDDVGEYTIIDTDNKEIDTKKEPINDPGASRTYDGNEATLDITWTDTEVDGVKRQSNNKLSESEEITIKSNANWGQTFKTTTKIGFHANQSWGTNTETEATLTESKGISMFIPRWPLEPTQFYDFNTAVYISKTDGVKVTHGARINSVASWWGNQYGQKPDPGLNLPSRFHYVVNTVTGDYWTLELDDMVRMQAREIYLTENEINSFSDTYDYLAGGIVDGETVRVCAKIHNYSLALTQAGPFKVRFEYVPVNPYSLMEMDAHTPIGYSAPVTLAAREVKEVSMVWDTTGIWDDYPIKDDYGNIVTYCGYRFYVTVDPDDDLKNEIHEWKDLNNKEKKNWTDADGRLYHGNNEGLWPWGAGVTVLHVPPGDPAHTVEIPHEVSLHENSLSIHIGDQVVTSGQVNLEAGKTYPLRVHVQHSAPSRWARHVFIYDGDPSETSHVIGDHVIFGNSGKDSWVWAAWTPREAKEYTLHAHVMEDHNDPIPGNAKDSLAVTVTEAKDSGDDDSACFINLLQYGDAK